MGRLKLFVSHSSRLDDMDQEHLDQDHNWKLLADTCALLRQEYGKNIEILVDQDAHGLYPGCDWEYRLNEWLAECHAAIILFSKRALTLSNWVKKEATILSWRRELDPNFTLIPVLLDGQVEPADLEKDLFGALRINKSQCVQGAASAADIVERIKGGIKGLAIGKPDEKPDDLQRKYAQTPYDKLKTVVARILMHNADGGTLRDAWEALADTGHKPPWNPSEKERFAGALVRYLFRDGEKCIAAFQQVIDKIRPRPEQKGVEEILRYIRSLWVEAKAAGMIPAATYQGRLAALNGRMVAEYSFERYLERAFPLSNDYRAVVVSESTQYDRIVEQIRTPFQQTRRRSLSPEECDRRINEYSRKLFICLPASEQDGGGILDDARLRRRLLDKYPNIVFVLATGDSLPAPVPPEIVAVQPALDLEVERKQLTAEENFEDFLDDYYGF